MTDVTIIAAIASNRVIGRSSKLCETCRGKGSWMLPTVSCPVLACNGTGRVPCNDMPWSYPEDLARFRKLTLTSVGTGSALIMGRRTRESIGFALPGRTNIVISSTMRQPHAMEPGTTLVTPSLTDALRFCDEQGLEPFVIGGRGIFAEALPLATTLELTLIDREYEGDVLWPGWDVEPTMFGTTTMLGRAMTTFAARGGPWRLHDAVSSKDDSKIHPDLTFTTWVRR